MGLSAISEKLYRALLDHHMAVRTSSPIPENRIGQHLITYGRLCEESGLYGMEIGVGKFLAEVAVHCQNHGWPPINALAVNSETRMPGEKYDLAEGCSLLDWPRQVVEVLCCHEYV
jgi:hypothetical protein